MRIVLHVVVLFFVYNVYGQHYDKIVKYDYIFGLPTEQVYNVFSDSEEYYWICTDNGIVKYNGHSFIRFSTLNGLPSNDIVDVQEDEQGRKWVIGYFKGFYYIYNNIVYKLKTDADISLIKEVYSYKNNVYFIGNKEIFEFNPKKKTFYKLYHEKVSNYVYPDLENNIVLSTKINGQQSFFDLIDKKKYVFKNKDIEITTYRKDNRMVYKIKNHFYILKNNHFYELKNFDTTKKVLNRKNSKYEIYYSDKIYVYKNDVYKEELSKILNGFGYNKNFINQIIIDKYENIWIGFQNCTYIYIPKNFQNSKNFYIQDFDNKKNNTIRAATAFKSTLFFTSYDELFAFNTKTNKTTKIGSLESNIYNIKSHKDFLYINCVDTIYTYQVSEEYKKIKLIKKDNIGYRNITFVKDSLYGIVGNKIRHGDITTIFEKPMSDMRIKLIDNYGGNLYFANEEWLYSYNLAQKKLHYQKFKNTNTFLATKAGLIIGTNSEGVAIKNRDLKTIAHFNIKDDCVNAIYFNESENLVLIGTNFCLYVLKFQKDKLLLLNKINKENGLIPGKVINITQIESKTYVVSQQGISIIDDLYAKSKLIGTIDIDFVENNSNKYLFTGKKLTFKRKNNTVTIATSLKGLNINPSIGQKFYALAKEGSTKEFKPFYDNKLTFTELAPGDYIFTVYVHKKNTLYNSKTKEIHFKIEPYFYETLLFKIIGIVSMITLIVLLTYYYKLKKSKELQLSNELMLLKNKVLKSQMNPHFIFNILNTLQNAVVVSNEREVNTIFASFSKLMRSSLEIMNHDFITIEEEIKYIKNYTALENIRKNEPLKVVFEISSKLNLNLKIPVMLVQPLVENVFIHAFNDDFNSKKMTVRFYAENTFLIIEVEDNGKGIESKKQYKIEKKSYATKIIKRRLSVLNLMYNTKNSINYYDLKKTKDTNGTLVVLKIEIKS